MRVLATAESPRSGSGFLFISGIYWVLPVALHLVIVSVTRSCSIDRHGPQRDSRKEQSVQVECQMLLSRMPFLLAISQHVNENAIEPSLSAAASKHHSIKSDGSAYDVVSTRAPCVIVATPAVSLATSTRNGLGRKRRCTTLCVGDHT
jgi:hypothetical protein